MTTSLTQRQRNAIVGMCVALAVTVTAVTILSRPAADGGSASQPRPRRDSQGLASTVEPAAPALSRVPGDVAGAGRDEVTPGLQNGAAMPEQPDADVEDQGDTNSTSPVKEVLAQLEAEYAVARESLNDLTSPVYNDMFRRGHFRTIPAGEPLPDISGKLVSVRYDDGVAQLAEIPREGFEYEYSLKAQIDAMTLDLVRLRQAAMSGD